MEEDLWQVLRGRGWVIQYQPPVALPEAILSRYPRLPQEVARFLGALSVCHNPSQNVWFLTTADYTRVSGGEGFAWNEIEQMSGESAFWDMHFPFLYAVHSDYDYLAVRLTENAFGSIVHGFAPFWNEPSVITPNFTAFLEAFTAATQSREPAWPYSVFLHDTL